MPAIHQNDYNNWTTDLAAAKAQIAAIISTLSDDTVLSGTKEYSFDSGTGIQREKFNSPQELISTLSYLQAKRDRLERILRGNGLMRGAVRR